MALQSGPGSGAESEEEELDREVRDSLCGLRGSDRAADYLSNASFNSADRGADTVSNASFHSADRGADTVSNASFHSGDRGADTVSNASFYSADRGADTVSTASYHSAATLRGSSPGSLSFRSLGSLASVETLVVPGPGSSEQSPAGSRPGSHLGSRLGSPGAEYRRPGCLAGSRASGTTSSRSSLASEGELSFAGRLNDQVGRFLGYGSAGPGGQEGPAMAAITGYEVVAGAGRERYTVYKLRVSLPGAVPAAWFIHRRYSDFLALRATLLKEAPGLAPRIPFPPKRWVGSNLEPAFLGRRLAGLQVFLATAMEGELRRSPALGAFLCLEQRPAGGGLEASRAVCDTLEETVRELREQLRKREQLEAELETMRGQALQRDAAMAHLEKENELLRQQKESLMVALSSGSSALHTSIAGRREKRSKGPGPKIESLEDFTAKFGLKSCEASPVRLRERAREGSGERRKSSIQ